MLPRSILWLFAFPALAGAADGKTDFGGHTKLNVFGQTYPSDSVFRDLYGSQTSDTQGELRLNVKHRRNGWTVNANYQLVALYGDIFVLPDDRRRYFDLTSVVDTGSKSALLHRLDRLWVGYTSEKFVARLGRQALSWGNGVFYAPMDLVNPFDPATIDTEYKAGDDLMYLQYLNDSGSDVQGAYVVRRNYLSGEVDSASATTAMKFHGFAGEGEFDVLLARHYQDDVLGFGASHALGGAHWSSDLVITDTETDTYVQLSTNLSYSWIWQGKNMSGVLEYHFNGMGQPSGQYDLPSIADNPDLLLRLARGEAFALGRHYFAGSVMIELTPLWTVSPTLLMNVGDPSGLLQMVTQYSLSDNMTLLGSLNIPLGSSGSEFGGTPAEVPGRYLSSGAGVFAQFAWYF
ncbi:MAG: hypothetical protein HOM16_02390 [Woeseia sp.]|nr:hypothetical protein [Woeseia sp.]